MGYCSIEYINEKKIRCNLGKNIRRNVTFVNYLKVKKKRERPNTWETAYLIIYLLNIIYVNEKKLNIIWPKISAKKRHFWNHLKIKKKETDFNTDFKYSRNSMFNNLLNIYKWEKKVECNLEKNISEKTMLLELFKSPEKRGRRNTYFEYLRNGIFNSLF